LAIEQRLRLDQRHTPLTDWSTHEPAGGVRRRTGALDISGAETFYRAHPELLTVLRASHVRCDRGEFDVFGTWVKPDSWHHDPIGNVRYDSALHWSAIKEHADADLKLVWEPSRFSWAFGLAHLHVADPTSAAAETFWRLFESWCDNNQPNAGVNWQCGQESSIRFMAVMFATEAFGETVRTAERETLLRSFADVTARRVLAHWRYARSQRNNHIVSEAVGLLGVAAFFPDLEVSPRAWNTGDRLLREACTELVFEDGGTSQYSLNYHRVFLDNFIWARILYGLADQTVPSELDGALDRATVFLQALVNTRDGTAPNYGHNDGARLLPTSSATQMDMRPTIEASRACRGHTHADSELAAWMPKPVSGAPVTSQPRTHYPQAGITLLGSGTRRASVRGCTFAFRPAHQDQLHTDLWLDGVHVITDPGTWSYKPAGGEPDLSLSSFHNGPVLVGSEDMKRASRFLFVEWSKVTHEVAEPISGRWVSSRVSPATAMTAQRVIETTERGWVITDEVALADPGEVATSWLLPSTTVNISSLGAEVEISKRRFRLHFEVENGDAALERHAAMICNSYRQSTGGTRLTFTSKRAAEHVLQFRIEPRE